MKVKHQMLGEIQDGSTAINGFIQPYIAFMKKTMENVRNRSNVYITNDKIQKRRLATQPHFKHATHFNENLAAVHMGKINCLLVCKLFF